MDELLVTVDNYKLVKHEGAYYIIYVVDEQVQPMTFQISDAEGEEIIKDHNAIYDVVVAHQGRALCCELWSVKYNH